MRDLAIKAVQNHSDEPCGFGRAGLPLVSVIITNYNYGRYLKECIESCLDQDYPYCQLILVDDCSTDNSADIVSEYSDRLKYIRHSSNRGQLAAFFTGLSAAEGEFTVFVDADDFLDADAVSAHIYLHLFVNPPVGFTCLNNRQVSENSNIVSSFHMDLLHNGKLISYVPPRVIHTPTWNWSTTSAMMFRTDMLRLIKTDSTDAFRVCADYYTVHFANLLGGSLIYNKTKVNYRRHGGNMFSKNFIIGGHKPTGDMNASHPSHDELQREILGKLIDTKNVFRPYFPSEERYCETLLYVADQEFIKNFRKLDAGTVKMLEDLTPKVEKLIDDQIEVKKKALELYALEQKEQKIDEIKNFLMSLYSR